MIFKYFMIKGGQKNSRLEQEVVIRASYIDQIIIQISPVLF